MEPRLYPPWEPRPLQELDPELRHAVEAIREEALPQDALLRALDRAGQLPGTARVPRPWFHRRVVLAADAAMGALVVSVTWYGEPATADQRSPLTWET